METKIVLTYINAAIQIHPQICVHVLGSRLLARRWLANTSSSGLPKGVILYIWGQIESKFYSKFTKLKPRLYLLYIYAAIQSHVQICVYGQPGSISARYPESCPDCGPSMPRPNVNSV